MTTEKVLNWKQLTDEERLQIVKRFNEEGNLVVGDKHDEDLLEEHIPFFLDTVRYNNELRLAIIPDSGGFIPADREKYIALQRRARIVCAPVIMPIDIAIRLIEESEAQ